MKAISLLLLLMSCATTVEDKELPLNRKLRQCYVESDSYTGMAGKVPGKILMELEIDTEGNVKKAEVAQSDFKDANLLACVKGIFRTTIMENKTGSTLHEVRTVNFKAVRR